MTDPLAPTAPTVRRDTTSVRITGAVRADDAMRPSHATRPSQATRPGLVARLSLAVALVVAALSAGFFYAFEASFILALAEVDDATYVTSFRAINETVRNPAFGLVFFGAVPVLAATAVLQRDSTVRRLLVTAGLVLHLGVVAITATGNVPLNEELAEPAAVADVAGARAVFEEDWNALNRTRTAVAVGALVMLVTAAVVPPVGSRPGHAGARRGDRTASPD